MNGPSAAHPCPHWPAEQPDERACLACPIAPAPCIYDREPGRPETAASATARQLLARGLSVQSVQRLTGLSQAQVYRLRRLTLPMVTECRVAVPA